MMKLAPQRDLEHGVTLHFQSGRNDNIAWGQHVHDRNALLQHVVLPVENAARKVVVPKEKKENPREEEQKEEEPREEEQKEEQRQCVTTTTSGLKDVEKMKRKYELHHTDQVRGRLVYQQPGPTWLTPWIALWESQNRPQKGPIFVCTDVSENVWYKQLEKSVQDELTQHHWTRQGGAEDRKWCGKEDKPSNYVQLSDEDQESVRQQLFQELRGRYRVLPYASLSATDLSLTTSTSGSCVVILDDVENWCDRIVRKNVDAVRLYNVLMSHANMRIVAVTQFPCFRDTEALVLVFNLLRGLPQLPVKKTRMNRNTTKKNNKTKKAKVSTMFGASGLPKDVSEFQKMVAPMVLSFKTKDEVELDVVRCEMSAHQAECYLQKGLSDRYTPKPVRFLQKTDAEEKLQSCNVALEKRPQPPTFSSDIADQVLYEREIAQLVDAQEPAQCLEKQSPKFSRVLEKLATDDKNKETCHVVYSRFDVEGALFRKVLEHYGFSSSTKEAHQDAKVEEYRKKNVVVYLVIHRDMSMTGEMVETKHVQHVHILESPAESLVELHRVVRCASDSRPLVHVYIATSSQTLLAKKNLAKTVEEELWEELLHAEYLDYVKTLIV